MRDSRKVESIGVTLPLVKRSFAISILLSAAIAASGQTTSRPEVPEKIKAPEHEKVILQAHASGSQVYTCQQSADGKYAWTLKAPEADLADLQGKPIGKHTAGPTWKHNDGSEVTGKASARVDAPDSDSIPWLLVTATGHAGNGTFSRVSSIQRIHTHGGQPPSADECNSSKANAEAKSSYTADYYFFVPPD